MAYSSNMRYKIFKDYNAIFDEKNSGYATLRMVQWIPEGKEEDESKAKLEIRKMYTQKGEEVFGKGFTFSTEQGPHELAEILVKNDFGDTATLLGSIVRRDDFKESLEQLGTDKDVDVDVSLFDMRDNMFFGCEDEDEEEEDEEE